ncbi:MAG: hypothetical protein O2U61_04255 [Candidatus Bathyarchaeota archaeon]|nr:hypothetical protein [Candidatus Bathyarchaeota archaeon]
MKNIALLIMVFLLTIVGVYAQNKVTFPEAKIEIKRSKLIGESYVESFRVKETYAGEFVQDPLKFAMKNISEVEWGFEKKDNRNRSYVVILNSSNGFIRLSL